MSSLVLIADDDPKRLEKLRRLIEREGADTVTAFDASAAMRLFVRREPDLTLLQVDPSDDRGMELCRDMKTLGTGRRRAVVVLGARASRSAAFDAGCDAFVDRRASDAALLHAVRRFLAQHRRSERTGAIELSP